MPSMQMKDEEFQNLGGINAKASPYITGPQQFSDLLNFDFQMPGALTKRWGSTQYFTQSYTGQIQSLLEFSKLSGSSYLVFSVSGGLWFGGTQAQFQGVSIGNLYPSVSLMSAFWSFYNRYNPISHVLVYGLYSVPGVYSNNTDIVPLTSPVNPYNYIIGSSLTLQNNFSYSVLTDNLYASDGNKLLRFNGATFNKFQLAYPSPQNFPAYVAGVSPISYGSTAITGLPLTFSYVFYAAYLGLNGNFGPLFPVGKIPVGASNLNQAIIGGFSSFTFNLSFNVVPGVAATSIITFVEPIPLINTAAGSTIDGQSLGIYIQDWGVNVKKVGAFPLVPGATYHPISWGITLLSGVDVGQQLSAIPDTLSTEFPTFIGATNNPGNATLIPTFTLNETVFAPKFLDVFNNQLIAANLPFAPSSVFPSDIALPDFFDIENEFEVRTNDGDQITATKAFGSNFYIFKEFSYHRLSGSDPTNFVLIQLSDQYGCLNDHCVVTYDNQMLFLDRKGVVSYNGAGQQITSYAMQPYFDQMNVTAAKLGACMMHDKQRNQILIGIPINGATMNNVTVVYDYLVQAWTKYSGFNPALFATIHGTLSNKTPFYAGYSGNIYNFGASFCGDNGAGYTVYLKTHFNHSMGDSIEKQYRRVYINTDPAQTGSSQIININVYPNYGVTSVFSSSLPISPFQNKFDFGISARSVAFDLSNFNSTELIRVSGYVLTYRYQRSD